MPLTRDQAQHLAELACTVRPEWTVTAALRGLYPLANHPADLATLAWAVIRAAAHVEQPADLPWNSPAWGLDRPPDDLEQLNPRQVAREAAQRAAGTLPDSVISADTPTTPQPNPCPDCGRDLDQDVAPGDPQRPACPAPHPAPGSLPHHAGHPDHTTAHHHAFPWRRGMTPTERRRSAQADAGKCLDPWWTECPAGTAWLGSYCQKPARHHDRHTGPDLEHPDSGTPVTWDRTNGPAPIDYCDHDHDDNGDPVNPPDPKETR